MSDMTIVALKENSELLNDILEIERLMNLKGISIKGNNLLVSVHRDLEYYVGRDRDIFPRLIEEPFWRYK